MQAGAMKQLHLQAVCAWALHQFGFILDSHGLFLSDYAAERVETSGLLYLQCYVRLAESALAMSRPRYKLRPKVHSFHCETLLKLRGGSRVNPRFHSCFNDEDYVGRCCSVGKQACHPNTMARRVLERILLQTNTWLMEKKCSREHASAAFTNTRNFDMFFKGKTCIITATHMQKNIPSKVFLHIRESKCRCDMTHVCFSLSVQKCAMRLRGKSSTVQRIKEYTASLRRQSPLIVLPRELSRLDLFTPLRRRISKHMAKSQHHGSDQNG